MHHARTFRKARATDATTTSFTAKTATTTEPSGDGVHDLALDRGGQVPCRIHVIPFGTGDENDVFDFDVWGWRRIGGGDQPNTLWVPFRLFGGTATLGTSVGVASSPVTETRRFADTLTIRTTVGEPVITADVTNSGTVIRYSPADNTLAWVIFDLPQVEKIEFLFDTTTGDPTGVNALFALL